MSKPLENKKNRFPISKIMRKRSKSVVLISKICGKIQKWILNLRKPREKETKENSQYQKALENQRKLIRNLKIHWTTKAPRSPGIARVNGTEQKEKEKKQKKKERTRPVETRAPASHSQKSDFILKKKKNYWKKTEVDSQFQRSLEKKAKVESQCQKYAKQKKTQKWILNFHKASETQAKVDPQFQKPWENKQKVKFTIHFCLIFQWLLTPLFGVFQWFLKLKLYSCLFSLCLLEIQNPLLLVFQLLTLRLHFCPFFEWFMTLRLHLFNFSNGFWNFDSFHRIEKT